MREVDTALGNMWGQLSSHSSLKERINIGKMFASAEESSRKGEEVMLEGKELPLHLSLQKAVLFCFHGAAIMSFLQALEHPMCASACASGPACFAGVTAGLPWHLSVPRPGDAVSCSALFQGNIVHS